MSRFIRHSGRFLMLGLLFFPLQGPAQMTIRDLAGTVTDGHNEPLKGAVVQIQNGVTAGVISYITGADGHYSFKRLDGETDYRFWATYRGQQSKVEKLSQFDSDRPKTTNLVVRLRD